MVVKTMDKHDVWLMLIIGLWVFAFMSCVVFNQSVNGTTSQDTTISHGDPQNDPQKINFFKISEIEAIEDSKIAGLSEGVWVCPICDDGVVLYVVKPSYYYDAAIGVYGTRDCQVVSKYCPDYEGRCNRQY